MPPSLEGFDHIHLYVTDRDAAEKWYREVLGMTRVEELSFWATDGGPLTLHDANHTVHLALFERPAQACRSTLALRVKGAQLLAWQQHLQNALGKAMPLHDHQVSWSLYFSDPYGNPFEITTYDYAEVVQLQSSK